MKNTRIFFLITACIAVFSSCQKEVNFPDGDPQPGSGGNGNNASIIGDWKFVGLVGNSTSTTTVSVAGDVTKTTMSVNYVTKNNSGTVKITNNQLIYSNLSYDIDTTAHTTAYMNGVLLLDMDIPVNMSLPPMNETSPYTRNTNDSITVTTSSLSSVGSTTAPVTAQVGMKISWASDTLILKYSTTVHTTNNNGGIPGVVDGTSGGLMKLKRQ